MEASRISQPSTHNLDPPLTRPPLISRQDMHLGNASVKILINSVSDVIHTKFKDANCCKIGLRIWATSAFSDSVPGVDRSRMKRDVEAFRSGLLIWRPST
jgi:hypothetical protein